MSIRTVAVSAPDWPQGTRGAQVLDSRDPASLFNACRYAALSAQRTTGAWSDSNWATDRRRLRSNLLLMHSLDDISNFERLLLREKPNLLLIGAMSLCMPGAIECARVAREILGDQVLIVLGGRHSSETIYLADRGGRVSEAVTHHAGSPLRLMASGRISPVFDAVVSGDGEYIIAALGELVAEFDKPSSRAAVRNSLSRLDRQIPGDWIVGWTEGTSIRTIVSRGIPIAYGKLPSPSGIFGVSTAFRCFHGRMTAHVFSDIGRGCIYDCAFCSERRSVSGGVRDLENSAGRLYHQFRDAYTVISEDHPTHGASAFVEDSVLLGGKPGLIDDLCRLFERDSIDILFGAQLTIDQILSRTAQIECLSRNGLRYLFIGVETLRPDEIGGMSKDTGRKREAWSSRLRRTLEFLKRIDVQCGCAVLFGLGESHASRIALLDALHDLRCELGCPDPISLNWAVQHPLAGMDSGAGYNYVGWGTPVGPYLDAFHQFGEASVNYPLPHVGRPRLDEVQEVLAAARAIRSRFVDRERSYV